MLYVSTRQCATFIIISLSLRMRLSEIIHVPRLPGSLYRQYRVVLESICFK